MKRQKRITKRERKATKAAERASWVRVVQHGQTTPHGTHLWHVTEHGQTITRERYGEAVTALADHVGGVDLVSDLGSEPILLCPSPPHPFPQSRMEGYCPEPGASVRDAQAGAVNHVRSMLADVQERLTQQAAEGGER